MNAIIKSSVDAPVHVNTAKKKPFLWDPLKVAYLMISTLTGPNGTTRDNLKRKKNPKCKKINILDVFKQPLKGSGFCTLL